MYSVLIKIKIKVPKTFVYHDDSLVHFTHLIFVRTGSGGIFYFGVKTIINIYYWIVSMDHV